MLLSFTVWSEGISFNIEAISSSFILVERSSTVLVNRVNLRFTDGTCLL